MSLQKNKSKDCRNKDHACRTPPYDQFLFIHIYLLPLIYKQIFL